MHTLPSGHIGRGSDLYAVSERIECIGRGSDLYAGRRTVGRNSTLKLSVRISVHFVRGHWQLAGELATWTRAVEADLTRMLTRTLQSPFIVTGTSTLRFTPCERFAAKRTEVVAGASREDRDGHTRDEAGAGNSG
jgi:hypothetical protein